MFVLLLSACGRGAATISDYGLYVIDLGEGTATALVEGTANSEVDVSPEGSRMVYSGDNRYPDVESADVSHSGFFVAGVDGSDPVLLTDEWVWRRMWFPDGSGVLYTVEQDGLFAFSMDDYSSTKLSDHRPAVVVFSEGGNILHGNNDGLFMSAVDGSVDRRLATFASDESHEWRINRRHAWRGWAINPEAPTHVAFNTGNRLMLAAIDDPGESRRLTDAPYRDFSYWWSPDGTKLMYIAEGNLYVARLDSREPALLAGGGVRDFEWSPDSARAAYIAEHGRTAGRSLYVVDADGGEPLLLSGQGTAFWPGWSPDGSHVAYHVSSRPDDDRARLFVSRLDGSDRRLVAEVTAEDGLAKDGLSYRPAPSFRWLRDSRRILYLTTFDHDRYEGELAVFDLHTDTTTTLTSAWRGRLEWSRVGDRFTYWARYGLYVADTDSGHQTQVGASSDQSHYWGDSWSPDGRWLVFNHPDGGYVVNADTGTKGKISDEEIGYRRWSPDDTRLAYATRRGVHLYDTATGHARKLATVSQGFSVIVPRWIPDGSAITVTVTFIDYE